VDAYACQRNHRDEKWQDEKLGQGAWRMCGNRHSENGDVGGDVPDEEAEQRNQPARLQETSDER
jgi:hypothetical protein